MASTFTIALPEPPVPPEHLIDLLHSNTLPSSIESSHTIAYIDELETGCHLRRAQLLQSIEAHKAILSPVRRLPPEILGEIFSLVVRATFDSYTPPPVTQHAPWLLTRVCRYWSEVALATSALWSMVYVNFDHGGVQRGGSVDKTQPCALEQCTFDCAILPRGWAPL
ncbi:F-box domain-containing protein [Mycena sanguinolenta]|uniref:F-box domain-containing protein n=1 Tax=Mycena sanguinolenta TaxID=230812 RepID=A0A8H7D9U9_9AGAR|nr:F-box domain-containing protein [Mycena sanguinolenta]